MTASGLAYTDPAARPALGASRLRVLAALQDAPGPLSVEDVAAAVGLHQNTARFHLEALLAAGRAERAAQESGHPGRPRMMYSAPLGGERVGQRSFRLLAEILASHLAAQRADAGAAGLDAGRAWGRYLVDRPRPYRQLDAAEATHALADALADIGFAPEVVPREKNSRVLLHHCPFLEVAKAHQEVVCAIHLGLMQGMLSELGAPVRATRLDPFVEPSLCVTHLSAPKSRGGSRRPTGTARAGTG